MTEIIFKINQSKSLSHPAAPYDWYELTIIFLVLNLWYSKKTVFISWLQMPWLLVSPGYQQVFRSSLKFIVTPPRDQWVNSLSLGKFEGNFVEVNFKLMLMTDGSGIYVEIDFRLISLDLTNEKSKLVQVMAWCHQATSHYLSQCWPSSISPYGITRPQWVKPTCSPQHQKAACVILLRSLSDHVCRVRLRRSCCTEGYSSSNTVPKS